MNSLSIGIVGLPNVGKSTLFNALTDSSILAANYPFATIEPNTGIVAVPDGRLEVLAGIYKSKKVIPATVTFVDIAGLVAGASKGEGLGNQFLAHIRSCSAIIQVVRGFGDSTTGEVILRSDSSKDPRYDIDVINTELVLADLQTVEKRLPRVEKEARINPKLGPQAKLLGDVKASLDAGTPLWEAAENITANPELWDWLQKELQLLTLKPIIYLFNVDEDTLTNSDAQAALTELVSPPTGPRVVAPAHAHSPKAIFVNAKLEDELRSLDDYDRAEMLESYGVHQSGLVQLIHAAYETLGLQSYLTAGEQEVRAWTIKRGATAPQAAGAIHGDFERGFIAAQVVDYNDLVSAGSEQATINPLVAAKATGRVRTEGKTYVMQPDDVVEFRFNVSK